MAIFFQVVLPIMAVFGAGFVLQRIRVLDVKSLAAASIYIFLPALVFTNLYEASFNQGYTVIVIYAFLLLFLMIVLIKICARVFKWTESVESGSILTTAFMNGGNYGVPVILFSIGEEAMPYAIFLMVLQTMIMNVFGVYYASRSTSGFLRALKTIFKMPATYAAVLGIGFQAMSVSIPESVYSTLTMLGNAAIPLMMVILGMQLASITSLKFDWQVILSASITRMVISPLFALLFIWLVPVEPVIGAVIVIVAAMPSAATTTMYAIEFDSEPDLVSSITLVTTLVSIITVTVLLNIIT
ncbi:AEC family transporter [Lentibacillus amyloliquefaciens]|uniref:Transporter n=1 Tax=Lentibacillus amyloliquefaciens TaxID=1472767 RepID=A0A0U4EAI2_9BACI|nr:AEC family transporter [Lentibacillus amyloliquefaciens]ALX50300.1 transporter [Lentibacillus amyloliquefaciens]